MEALINFEEILLKNIHCSSGGKNLSYFVNLSFPPEFGDFRKFFKILAEVSKS